MNAPPTLPDDVDLLVGADGGGTGTRLRLLRRDGRELGGGVAGPSGLAQGVPQAWRHLHEALRAACAQAGLALPPARRVALSFAVAGAEDRRLHDAFVAANPGHPVCLVENDALGALRGAFGGAPGRLVAAGTGSVAAARWPEGRLLQIGGWGFPAGDEGSGAWLGLRAVQLAQAVFDGRAEDGALPAAVRAHCGARREALLDWCLAAGQPAYAGLAPRVFEAAEAGDARAERLLQAAADELAALAVALQPPQGPALPVVLAGSVGRRLAPRWDGALRSALREPLGDAVAGALSRLVPMAGAA